MGLWRCRVYFPRFMTFVFRTTKLPVEIHLFLDIFG